MRLRVLSLLGFVALWWAAAAIAQANSVPGPDLVFRDLLRLVESGQLLTAFRLSLGALLVGGLLSAAVGIPLGVLMGVRKALGASLDMYFIALYVSPMSALVPLLVLWFGFAYSSRVVFIFLFTLPQIVITCYQGALQTPRLYLDVARSFGATGRALFWKVVVPHETPFIITALRLGVGRGIQGMVVAEVLIGGTDGLGYLIAANSAALNISPVLGAVLTVLGFGILATAIVRRVEQAVSPWRTQEQRKGAA